MKKLIVSSLLLIMGSIVYAQNDTTKVIELDGVSVVSFYRNTVNTGSLLESETLVKSNYGQEPSFLFKSMPSIFAFSDNGTEFGYGYFRIRGLDQTRINVTLDGCPWNEAEDFGTYFANSPDLMSSMESIKVERGASASYNGIAGSAGGINLESTNVFDEKESYAYAGGGSYSTFKITAVYNMKPTEKWGLHIKATQSQTDGYRDFGFNNSQAFTVKAGYKISPRHTLDIVSMSGYHRNGQGWIGCTKEELGTNIRANGNTEDEDDNWFMSMNRLQYKGWFSDNLLFVSSVYYQGQTGSYRMDLDNYMRRMVDSEWETTGILYDYGLTHNMLGGNAVVKWYLENLTLTGGTNVYNFNRRHFSADKGKNVPVEERYDNNGNKTDANVFISASYNPIKSLSISGNVQYRNVQFSYTDNITPGLSFDSKNTHWNFINFGGSVEYVPVKDLKCYVRYSRVNREPTRSDMFGGNEYYIGELATTKPEIANDIELGAEFASRRFTGNINLFYMWFKDELVLNGEYGLNGLPCHENAEESYRRGIELAGYWNILYNLHFDNTISFSDNKVKTPTYGEKTHILTPNGTWNSDLYWKDKNWNVGLNFNYRTGMFLDMENKHSLPDAYTLNLYGSVRIRNVEIGCRLNNLTNRHNYINGGVGVGDKTLYIQSSGINVFGNLIFYF